MIGQRRYAGPVKRRRRFRRPAARSLGAILALVGLVAVVVVNAAWEGMRRSTPRTSGEVVLAGIAAEVRIARDAWGRPRIDAATFDDAAFALGFLHAQDRFFQMDLARRFAGGRLAELLGPPAVATDIESRAYEPTRIAAEVLGALPERHRRVLRTYAEGVNAGLADLGAPPPEYLLLAITPEPWTETDSLLVVLGMWRGLALVGTFERQRSALESIVPESVVRFLLPETTRFDAPVVGGTPHTPIPIPGPEVFDPRTWAAPHHKALLGGETRVPGSNGWAVAGSRTADGRAILANDMHLGLMVPTQWYWAELAWRDGADQRDAIGVTLPGVPAIVAGSNGHIAWGFTNVTGDVADWVIVEPVEGDPSRYRTPEGDEPFIEGRETIRVRFAPDRIVDTQSTRWGRIRRTDTLTRPMALKWTGTEPDCIDLGLLDMLQARSVEEALDTAAAWNGPPQNVVVAAADGRIGWTIAGRFPVRSGIDGRRPASWAEPGVGWTGFVPTEAKARVIDPPQGFIATANARTVGADEAAIYGHHFAPAFRQARIAEVLKESIGPIDEAATAALQNDTRLESMDFWRNLVIEAAGDDAELADAAEAARDWNGHADLDSAGLPLIVGFRSRVLRAVFGSIDKAAQESSGERFSVRGWLGHEESARRLVEERPAHWVPRGHDTWESALRDSLRAEVREDPAGVHRAEPVVARILHPLSAVIGGALRRWDMPRDRIGGNWWAVRVMGPDFGASQRMAISPGHEDAGVVEIPCGPSGHPMHRWYRSTHRAWVEGRSVPAVVPADRAGFTLTPR